MASDGLDALDRRRAQANGRRMPPARHPKAPRAAATATTVPEAHIAVDLPVSGERAAEKIPRKPVEAPQPVPVVENRQETPQRRRSRVRATQVHLDEIADNHLTELRKRAVLSEVDLTSSAILRLALSELVDRHGYDGIVSIFANDDGRLRRGRPRL